MKSIWLPLALAAGTLVAPSLGAQSVSTDDAIRQAKIELEQAQRHLEELVTKQAFQAERAAQLAELQAKLEATQEEIRARESAIGWVVSDAAGECEAPADCSATEDCDAKSDCDAMPECEVAVECDGDSDIQWATIEVPGETDYTAFAHGLQLGGSAPEAKVQVRTMILNDAGQFQELDGEGIMQFVVHSNDPVGMAPEVTTRSYSLGGDGSWTSFGEVEADCSCDCCAGCQAGGKAAAPRAFAFGAAPQVNIQRRIAAPAPRAFGMRAGAPHAGHGGGGGGIRVERRGQHAAPGGLFGLMQSGGHGDHAAPKAGHDIDGLHEIIMKGMHGGGAGGGFGGGPAKGQRHEVIIERLHGEGSGHGNAELHEVIMKGMHGGGASQEFFLGAPEGHGQSGGVFFMDGDMQHGDMQKLHEHLMEAFHGDEVQIEVHVEADESGAHDFWSSDGGESFEVEVEVIDQCEASCCQEKAVAIELEVDEGPNWVFESPDEVDFEIEALIAELESDFTESTAQPHAINVFHLKGDGPAGMIKLEQHDLAEMDEIEALIIELESGLESVEWGESVEWSEVQDLVVPHDGFDEPILMDAEVEWVSADSDKQQRIEELEAEVTELRELVESLVKELNQR